jgi:hypothetical protein
VVNNPIRKAGIPSDYAGISLSAGLAIAVVAAGVPEAKAGGDSNWGPTVRWTVAHGMFSGL